MIPAMINRLLHLLELSVARRAPVIPGPSGRNDFANALFMES
jgi:hypothetical protein